jgi:hypothetical protein
LLAGGNSVIRERTGFVIGAGASKPYRFPTGPELLREARELPTTAVRGQTGVRFTHELLEKFRETMLASQSDSIDSMMEYRKDMEEVGRYFIAARILQAEFNSINQYPTKEDGGDWISYLFRQMDFGSFQDFCDRPVTFITYNYDRLIEQRLTRGLEAKFKAGAAEISRYWTDRPVIHLHGSVGGFTKDAPKFAPFGAAVFSDQNLNHETRPFLENAAAGIKIVHEAAGDSLEFRNARQALREAVTVFFLGFSFGRVNVDRLELGNASGAKFIACSRYHMSDSECDLQIGQPFRRLVGRQPELGEIDDDCEMVLRNHVSRFVQRY